MFLTPLIISKGLQKLSNYEVDFKEKNASRSMIKAAAFPFVKELRDYDFSFQPSVNVQEIKELCTLSFLERHENIVFLGPSGVGKTHLATSIGIAAAKKRVSTHLCGEQVEEIIKDPYVFDFIPAAAPLLEKDLEDSCQLYFGYVNYYYL